jgi:AraC family transcriptional regulator
MSLQTSSMIDWPALDRSEFQSTLQKQVQIEPLTHTARLEDDALAILQVRIREGIFHYFTGLRQRADDTSHGAVPRPLLATVEQLSKALHTAGIDIRKLECSAENALRVAVVASLVETLAPCVRPVAPKRTVPALAKWRLNRVQAYIEKNICESITLEDLAATAGLSRMYFSRQFQAATGISPHEYLLRKRIERAQHRLATTADALAEIGLSVGFQTQAHFSTVFKKFVGYTPLKWRREQPDCARHARL